MRLPDFFIIGAAKAGTSSLYRYIKQHPQVFMSPKKEPHFFSFDDQSKLTKGPGDTIPQAVTNLEDYARLFESAPEGAVVGEASTSYLYRKEAPERIKTLVPEAKCIAVLRNPVDRAYSAYMHLVRDGRMPNKTFGDALAQEKERIADNWDPIWHFVHVGLYHEQLLRYYRYFPKDQIKVFLYEDFTSDPMGLVRQVFQFLGVDDAFIPQQDFKSNVSGEIKKQALQKWIRLLFDTPNPIRWISRKVLPEKDRFRFSENVRGKNLQVKRASADERARLLPFFREDVLALQELIQRDLSGWLRL